LKQLPHMRYTAREGGAIVKIAAVKSLQGLINQAAPVGSVRLFSVLHELPTEWEKFEGDTKRSTTPTAIQASTLLWQHKLTIIPFRSAVTTPLIHL